MSWQGARVLVAGSSGFVGGHLVAALRREGCEVIGLSRHGGTRAAASTPGGFTQVAVDLRDAEATRRIIGEVRPTHVLHAAGILPGPGVGWSSLHDGNVLTTVNLLDAISAEGLDPWILLTSSSAVYGSGTGEPLAEDSPFRPISWYGVAKAAQELLGIQAEAACGARAVRVRLFNLVGPRQPPSLVISAIARQIAAAERGSGSVVQVGNLDPERDYLDVRDAAAALVLLADEQSPPGAYNVASEKARSVRECVDVLLQLAQKPLTVETVEDRQRKVDIQRQVGDSAKLRAAIRWRPTIAFEDSLLDVLEHWRGQIRI